jgi:hypothetical protein
MAQSALGVLSSAVRKVTLQFSMQRAEQVPHWVTWIKEECVAERDARKTVFVPGEQFLVPDKDASGRDVNDVSLVGVVDDLEAAGYILVEAIAQERLSNKAKAPPYAMVRYVFYRRELALRTPEFRRYEANIMSDLREFLELALWRTRGFRNPYFQNDGTVLHGFYGISINMEARNPRFVGNDRAKPRTHWLKDEEGNRVGDAPVLSAVPAAYLGIDDGEICMLVDAPTSAG